MTLTAFLLARFAEDEADAQAVAGWQARERRAAQPESVFVTPRLIDADHLRADLEAKRRIVEMFSGNLHERWDDGYEAEKIGREILAALALPYASHPDYRATQRP